GYVRKTTYQYLASLNPWLWVPSSFKNTWIEERYAGFKGSVGDHFTYSTKVGFHKYNNQPLFINDTSQAGDGKSFEVVNEPQMKVLHFGVEAGYTVQEKFSLIAGLTFNQYNSFQQQDKAWGLIPVELKAAMRLQVLKDLWVKSDLFAWQGPLYMKKDGNSDRLRGAFDLNAGVEFRILPNLNLWTQFNNIFNKEYQRWSQYPVYGFNFVGGIVFSFNQKQ
ncbi:MAG: TonB-dependent receptor, partial [Bacteroidota bacterium]|nr:TonB-dependent receptor [Bacteroidota bacterium]